MTVAADHASWITLPQAVACHAIERVVRVRCGMRGSENSLRLWIGPVGQHQTSWFEVSAAGEITSTTRADGKRTTGDVSIDDLPFEAMRLAAWADGIQVEI